MFRAENHMRNLIILLLAFAATAAAVQTPGSNGSIAGTVKNVKSGELLDDVQITLNGRPGDKPIVAVSDRQGRFMIKDVPPGRYLIRAQRDGYFAPGGSGQPVNPLGRQIIIRSGQELTDIDFEMIPGGSISGRITGPDGKPIARLTVSAWMPGYRDGQSTLQIAATAETDDRGDYRLFWLEPGEYIVSAERRPTTTGVRALPESLGKTFYPGVVNQNSAASISVTPESEINASFPLVSTATFKISGRVISNIPNTSSSVGSFVLVPRDSTDPGDGPLLTNQARDRASGQFELGGVQPGAYNLYPVVRGAGRGADGLPLMVLNGPLSAFINEAGAFTFLDLPESRYQFQPVTGLPEGAYVADICQGGKSVFEDGMITVSPEAADPVQLVVRFGGGSIEGAVLDSEQKPVAMARVSLIPHPTRRQNPIFYKRSTSDANGRFVIKGIAPGDYKLFAWDTLQIGADENPRFIALYENRGQTVTVNAGVPITAAIELIRNASKK
jgi:protocatechuate 3,4-dioxygenase beta subunit